MTARLTEIARQFFPEQTIHDLASLGNGLINDTYLVSMADSRFVLQRINNRVFARPDQMMENLERISLHIHCDNPFASQITLPAVYKTASGQPFHIDSEHRYWRALEWIKNSESRESISNHHEAAQIGLALGRFHRRFSDMNPQFLHDTLPDFHITPRYLAFYRQVKTAAQITDLREEFDFCQHVIETYQKQAGILEQARQQGLLRERVIHGDPKLNNFLFAKQTNTVISLIDLDTVKPGLAHYDIGDCLRSCCHNEEKNCFNLDICATILKNYTEEVNQIFSASEYDYLFAAILLIPYELGLRFFTDFLTGNHYFKVTHPEQNLHRAAAQFALCNDIFAQQTDITDLIRQLQNHR